MSPATRPIVVAWLALALPAQEPVPSPLAVQIPELLDQSSWAQDTRYEGSRLDKSRRGVYPVGNGKVFAYVGLGARANTLQGITGPSYQTSEVLANKGHFGEVTFELVHGEETVELPLQRVRRVRGANFVITEDASPQGLALRTVTFAPPEQTSLVRVLEVINRGRQTVNGLALRMVAEGALPQHQSSGLRRDYAVGERACTAFYSLEGARVLDSSLVLAIDELGPDMAQRAVFTLSTVSGNPPWHTVGEPPIGLEKAAELALANLAWWGEKLAGTTRLETDHEKLRDLHEDWKVLMLVQRCARSGVITPMINARGAQVKDSSGTILALLRYGLREEARDILRHTYAVACTTGQITGRVPLDLDVEGTAPGDWNSITVMGNEVPSWIILQHFWYWRATRDTALIRKHWPLLEVCLKRQPRGPQGEMKFDGDGGVLRRAVYRQGQDTYSFANGVLFLIAVQAMAEMTTEIDREVNPDRYADESKAEPRGAALLARSSQLMADLEKLYWVEEDGAFAPALEPVELTPFRTPFANSNLLPLWLGWTFPSGQKSPLNLRKTLESLWRSGARIGTTPTVEYATGELQGMLVAALAERNGRRRLDAVDALLEMAEPAGEWGELYDSAGRPVATELPDWPNRLRPGESGINLDAIMFALTGVRYASYASWDVEDIRLELRLPHEATYLAVRNVQKDGRILDLHMREVHETMSEDSWMANMDRLSPDQRDPYQPHRNLHFVVDLLSANPPQGYYNLAVNAVGTVFMRYLRREEPVEETSLWIDDSLEFLPADGRRRKK